MVSFHGSVKGQIRKELGSIREDLKQEIEDPDSLKRALTLVTRINTVLLGAIAVEVDATSKKSRARFEADQTLKQCLKDS